MKKYNKLEMAAIDAEYKVIIHELIANKYRMKKTADALEIDRKTLYNKIKVFKKLKKIIVVKAVDYNKVSSRIKK